jgi:hypothetical protein
MHSNDGEWFGPAPGSFSEKTTVRRQPGPEHKRLVSPCLKEAPGFLSATVIPPHTEADQGEYQVVQRFATQADPAQAWQHAQLPASAP